MAFIILLQTYSKIFHSLLLSVCKKINLKFLKFGINMVLQTHYHLVLPSAIKLSLLRSSYITHLISFYRDGNTFSKYSMPVSENLPPLHLPYVGVFIYFFFHFLFYFFKFYFIFKLYIIVLVLPNIKMNPPQVYMCSPT